MACHEELIRLFLIRLFNMYSKAQCNQLNLAHKTESSNSVPT